MPLPLKFGSETDTPMEDTSPLARLQSGPNPVVHQAKKTKSESPRERTHEKNLPAPKDPKGNIP